MNKLAFLILPFLIFPVSVFAHSGGQDSSGGHFDRKTGKYHCHNKDTCTTLTVPEEHQIPDPIRIATFNIEVFGNKKSKKSEIMKVLASIIREYDLVAVQEIKDASGNTPKRFLDEINKSGDRYDMRVSERTGLQTNDKSSQEQYGYYFNTKTITPLDNGQLFDDSGDDFFQREPFISQFKAKSGNFSFVLISIHTKPTSAVKEIEALHNVVEWARGRYSTEDDFIVLGDYNAGCDYANPTQLDAMTISGSKYTWIVPHDANTNLASKQCAYDRIVITNGAKQDYAGKWDVDRSFDDKKVSDHWPVWAEFNTNSDTGN